MTSRPLVIPISDLRHDTAGVIERAAASDDPVVITQHGRASAVLVSARSYERTQHELEILRILARGERDIEACTGHELEKVMADAREYLAAED